MRADICRSDDGAALERFRETLRRLGAQVEGKGWAIGVDHHRLQIAGEHLSIFSDAWEVDIEGPDELVERVVREFERPPTWET